MKKLIVILFGLFIAKVAMSGELQTEIKVKDVDGRMVTVYLDACYDPVTKHWGPCYVVSSDCEIKK
jgi:hypothetical protein